jgi:replicative DNA helicase
LALKGDGVFLASDILKQIDNLPPQNIEAEKSLLGSILLDKEAIVKIADFLRPEDFYRPNHKEVYQAMLSLYESKNPIDIVTLSNELEKTKKLKEIGGASYVTNLANSVPSSAHAVQYAKIIQSKATLRRLISASQRVMEMGYDQKKNIEEILDGAEKTIFEVSQAHLASDFIPIREILAESFDRIDELHKHKGKLRGIGTGFTGLDNILAGFQKSDMIVIAARPSMGKTSLALNIAAHAAIREKVPAGVFSLEMSKEQLVDRLICSEAGIDSWKLRTGKLSEDDFPRIGYAMGVLSEAPLYIDDSPMLNVMEIRTKARRLQAEYGLGMVIVDYLQLMAGSSRHDDNRVQEISEISRSLKALARELNIPVIAVSQLSRAVEMRPDHRPQLADLRESGSIEQDADVVIFLFREDYYDKDTDRKNIADILIKKHRNGPTGELELYFAAEQLAFKNLEKQREEASV